MFGRVAHQVGELTPCVQSHALAPGGGTWHKAPINARSGRLRQVVGRGEAPHAEPSWRVDFLGRRGRYSRRGPGRRAGPYASSTVLLIASDGRAVQRRGDATALIRPRRHRLPELARVPSHNRAAPRAFGEGVMILRRHHGRRSALRAEWRQRYSARTSSAS
jgi:hypothetical protein